MDFATERMNICKKCAICNLSTQVCTSTLWIDPMHNVAYDSPGPGRIKGCGCYLPNKTKRKENVCPAKKW